MPVYVVCRKKRNNPRMDIRVCALKCDLKEECSEFKSSGRDKITQDPSADAGSADLKAA